MGCLEVLLESVMSVSVEGKSKHGGKRRVITLADHLKEWDPSGWGTDHVIPLVPYPEPQNGPIP